jgi:hypothetical protein
MTDSFFSRTIYKLINMTIGLSCEQLAARMTGKTAIMIMLRRNALRLYLYLLFCRDKACIVFYICIQMDFTWECRVHLFNN